MSDFEFEITGAPIIYTDIKPKPYNPLNRPVIHYTNFAISVVIFLTVGILLSILTNVFLPWPWPFSLLAWIIIFIAIVGKRAAVWLVHLYQNKARDAVRLKCVFEPSCSEYMILCLERYGLIIGGIKGVKRLLRCHPPNGGKDYPYEL